MPDDPMDAVREAERLVREATERAQQMAEDLQRQLQQALRELLIALRAVLDYSIDRLEPGREPPPATVEDIPIS